MVNMMDSVMAPFAPAKVVISALRTSRPENRRFSARRTCTQSMTSTQRKRVARSRKVTPNTSAMSVVFVMVVSSHVSRMA